MDTKQVILRLLATLVLSVLVFNGVWWLAIPLFLLCLIYYNTYEFVFLAFCIDVYFAPNSFTFYYTFGVLLALIAMMFIRPRLFMRQL